MIVNQMGGGTAGESVERFKWYGQVDTSHGSDETALTITLPFNADYVLIGYGASSSAQFPLTSPVAFARGALTYYYAQLEYGKYAYGKADMSGSKTEVKMYNTSGNNYVYVGFEAIKFKEA